jgi:hypothetical protein
VPPNFDRPSCSRLGDCADDLQIAWPMIGRLVALWARKDLQARFTQWRSPRRGE